MFFLAQAFLPFVLFFVLNLVLCFVIVTPTNITFPPYSTIASGNGFACAILVNGSISCNGVNNVGQSTPPSGVYQKIDAYDGFACGLTTDGAVNCWGSPLGGQTNAPPGVFIDVCVHRYSGCAIRPDLTSLCWGNGQLPTTPQNNNRPYLKLACGGSQFCGISSNSTIDCPALPNTWSNVIDLAIDENYFCTIDVNNQLYCGQAINSTTTIPLLPSFPRAKRAAILGPTFCAILLNDSLWCSVPPIQPIPKWKAIQLDGGANSICALSLDGLNFTCLTFSVLYPLVNITTNWKPFIDVSVDKVSDEIRALLSDGSLWFSASTAPSGQFSSIATGFYGYYCYLNTNKTVGCNFHPTPSTEQWLTITVSANAYGAGCGIMLNGSLYCFGSNYGGFPAQQYQPGNYTDVSCGGNVCLGLLTNGTLNIFYGNATLPETGDVTVMGTAGIVFDPPTYCYQDSLLTTSCTGWTAPTVNTTFTNIVGGSYAMCFLDTNGIATCTCSIPNCGGREAMNAVSTAPFVKLSKVSVGNYRACGILQGSGGLICWGDTPILNLIQYKTSPFQTISLDSINGINAPYCGTSFSSISCQSFQYALARPELLGISTTWNFNVGIYSFNSLIAISSPTFLYNTFNGNATLTLNNLNGPSQTVFKFPINIGTNSITFNDISLRQTSQNGVAITLLPNINDVTFNRVHIISSGTVGLTYGNDFTCKECVFSGNFGAKLPGGCLSVFYSTVKIVNSFFQLCGNPFTGGGVYGIGSNLTILDSNFTSCQSPSGGAVFVEGTTTSLFISGGTFLYNSGSAVYASAPMNMEVSGVNFDSNSAPVAGAIYTVNSKNVEIQSCNFTHNTGIPSAIFISAPAGASSSISNSNFVDHRNNAISCQGMLSQIVSLSITSTIFDSNVNFNGQGGAITASYCSLDFTDVSFLNCSAIIGGGISAAGGSLRGTRLLFDNTSSTNGGSAVALVDCPLSLSDSVFKNCLSIGSGGIFVNDGSPPYFSNTNFSSNYGLYATNDYTSVTNDIKQVVTSSPSQLLVSSVELLNQTSGNPFSPGLNITVMDTFGNLMMGVTVASVEVSAQISTYSQNLGFQLLGQSFQLIDSNGVASFSASISNSINLGLLGPSDLGTIVVVFSATFSRINGVKVTLSNSTTIALRDCLPGEQYSSTERRCLPCPIGTFNNMEGSRVVCSSCDIGFFTDVPGLTACQNCTSGKTNNAMGSTTCTDCRVGFFSTSGSPSCSPCPPGTSAPSGSSNCTTCPLGKYRSSLDSDCLFCSTSGLVPFANQTGCELCPIGTFAAAVGSPVCSNCTPGFASGATGQHICISCTAGKYSGSGAASCSSCPSGFTSDPPYTDCHPCAPGFIQGPQGDCAPCDSGSIPNTNQTTCQACPAGSFASVPGSANCTTCEAGSYTSATGQSTCVFCEPGKVSEGNSSQCTWCPAGMDSPVGSGICEPCSQGKARETQQMCTPCDAGRYTPGPGATICFFCPTGANCANGTLESQSGYWINVRNQTQNSNAEVQAYSFLCPPDICLSGNRCASGRKKFEKNPLCGQCLDGYSEWSGKCVECSQTNGGAIFGIILIAATYVFVIHLVTQTPAGSGLVQILMYFVQIAGFMVGQPALLAWIRIFNFQPHDSTPTCIAPLDPYAKAWLEILSAFIFEVLLGVFYGIHKIYWRFYRQGETFPVGTYKRTFIYLLILSYTQVTSTVFRLLNCVEIESGVKVVFTEPGIDCHSSQYQGLLVGIFVLLVVDVIPFPLFTFAFLFKNRKLILERNREFYSHYGSLFDSYKAETYWFQTFSLLRRTVIIILDVILFQWIAAKFMAFTLVNVLFLLIQFEYSPFTTRLDNITEKFALSLLVIVSCICTVWDPTSDNIQVVLFILIGIPTILFCLLLAHYYFGKAKQRLINRGSLARKEVEMITASPSGDLFQSPGSTLARSSVFISPDVDAAMIESPSPLPAEVTITPAAEASTNSPTNEFEQ